MRRRFPLFAIFILLSASGLYASELCISSAFAQNTGTMPRSSDNKSGRIHKNDDQEVTLPDDMRIKMAIAREENEYKKTLYLRNSCRIIRALCTSCFGNACNRIDEGGISIAYHHVAWCSSSSRRHVWCLDAGSLGLGLAIPLGQPDQNLLLVDWTLYLCIWIHSEFIHHCRFTQVNILILIF